jgi:hypothetical protein
VVKAHDVHPLQRSEGPWATSLQSRICRDRGQLRARVRLAAVDAAET